MNTNPATSVPNPWHFETDPHSDPESRSWDTYTELRLRIWIRILLEKSVPSNKPTKTIFPLLIPFRNASLFTSRSLAIKKSQNSWWKDPDPDPDPYKYLRILDAQKHMDPYHWQKLKWSLIRPQKILIWADDWHRTQDIKKLWKEPYLCPEAVLVLILPA